MVRHAHFGFPSAECTANAQVHTWDDGADWRGRPDHAPKTELTAAMQGLINAVEVKRCSHTYRFQ